jgi:mono/diheme cytochrome c family protein
MKTCPTLYLLASAITAAVGCTSDLDEPSAGDGPDVVAACTIPTIDVDRSLFVSPTAPPDQMALRARFSVSRIMSRILATGGTARPADGTELFRRWWDTQNSSATAAFPDNPHCDANGGTINGFPVACPRNEGVLAQATPDSHFPVALVFRPDLAAADGSSCGQARIVVAKPPDGTGRNLAIFEASIPNPEPGCGLSGCRKIAQFWANLSTVGSFPQRLDALERFYFTGLDAAQDGVTAPPVLDAANLGLPDAAGVRRGQIRTNQFMNGPRPPVWQLREFQLAKACDGPPGCRLFFEPVSVKTNPFGALFNDNAPLPLGSAFRNDFLGQISALAAPDPNAISMAFDDVYNAGQSTSQGPENQYGGHLAAGNPAGFRQAITGELAALGIPLTADNIVARATTQSCAGCHQLSNGAPLGGRDPLGNPLRWPPSANFVHAVENGNRSPALNQVFLPRRQQILSQFLADTCTSTCTAPRVADPTPIGGPMSVH